MDNGLDKWRRELAQARRRRERAAHDLDATNRDLALIARDAQAAGLPVKEVAEIIGYTRKAVYDLWEREGIRR